MNNVTLDTWGLDVPKATITVAIVDASGPPTTHGTIANDPGAIRKLVQKVGGPEVRLVVAYEAGPTGYALYQQLSSRGVECQEVAPSLVPKRPGDRVKIDARDALALARLLPSGDLTPTYIPDTEQEALRDLVRSRFDAKDAKRAQHLLLKFLLRQGD
ncbi:MAG TPA: transposase [Candidatus Dormibacteraeota bacterium]|jgi:transposase|nr:transposase [Candidatus Dormibacteraeota bacterium]